MTAGKLIKILETMDSEKILIMTDPSGKGWTNIGNIEQCESTIKIKEDGDGLFHDS
jgi:hypothetical protein